MSEPVIHPWFGSWPLKKRDEEGIDMKIIRQISILMMGVICFLIGSILLLSSNYIPWLLWQSIVIHLGTAFYTATIIGFTIEFALRKQLARDVFEAAFGYVLPKELQPELQWLCNQNIICTNSAWTINLTYFDGDKDTIILHFKNTQVPRKLWYSTNNARTIFVHR